MRSPKLVILVLFLLLASLSPAYADFPSPGPLPAPTAAPLGPNRNGPPANQGLPSWQPPFLPATCPKPLSRAHLTVHATSVVVPILMYHQLKFLTPAASKIRRGLTVSPASFQQQMAYLSAHGYQAIGPEDLAAYFKDNVALPDRPVMITFDDGWVEDYTVAYPTLKAYCLRGVFFPPTDWIGRSPYTLTWKEIEEMSRGGMEFGSHTMNHHLLSQESRAEVLKQLTGSRSVLDSHLVQPVTSLAYPGGALNKQVASLVAATGYETAFSVQRGVQQTEKGLYWLHRQPIRYDDDLKVFAAKLTPSSAPVALAGQ